MKFKILFIVMAVVLGVSKTQAGSLSEYDRQIVASCMVLEAGCDGAEGLQAVLNVIVNRADGHLNRIVPQTIKYGAFSCMARVWNTPNPDYSPLLQRAQNQSEVFNTALRLLTVMEKGILWDNTHGATHYHAVSIRPYWVSDMSYITTIGGHHFYTDHVSPSYASL